MDERAEQPGCACAEFVDKIFAAFRAHDLFSDAQEDPFDLFVQLGAVGDDQDAGIGHMLVDPFGEPDHRQALAAALRVPDDAALATAHALLGRDDAEVLMRTTHFLDAMIEDDKVVDDLKQPLWEQNCVRWRSSLFAISG